MEDSQRLLILGLALIATGLTVIIITMHIQDIYQAHQARQLNANLNKKEQPHD